MILARKHCSNCGHWRPAFDFTRDRAASNGLRSWCKACERRAVRATDWTWYSGYCRRGHRYTPETTMDTNGRRQCRTCYNAARKKNRQENPAVNEYQRIWKHAKRSEAGIKPSARGKKTPGRDNMVLTGPFAEWLREKMPPEERPRDLAWLNDYRPEEFGRWASGLGLDGSHARKLLRGDQKTIHIDVIDRALTNAGEPWMLNELYPLDEMAVA